MKISIVFTTTKFVKIANDDLQYFRKNVLKIKHFKGAVSRDFLLLFFA